MVVFLVLVFILTPSGDPDRPWDVWYPVPIETTAYTDAGGMPPWGITASGSETNHGTVAAPPSVPFGTKLFIPGYGMSTVKDRGCAIQGRRIDLWFPSEQEANKWGRKTVTIWVRNEPWPSPAPSKCPKLGH